LTPGGFKLWVKMDSLNLYSPPASVTRKRGAVMADRSVPRTLSV
jgi:hypothetical protein